MTTVSMTSTELAAEPARRLDTPGRRPFGATLRAFCAAWSGRLLGLAGAAAGLAFGAGAWPWVAAVALLGAGAWLDHHHAARARQARLDTERYLAGSGQLGRQLMPVWSGHIETSRLQMESAISALSERFAGIVDRLDHAMKASDSAAGADHDSGGMAAMFASSQQELQAVLASLRQATESNNAMRGDVQGLSRFIEELRQMATDVAKIAAQTNLLAINAAIEAAHAGESGRSFSVLAQEVRKLSAESGETGRRMAEKVSVVADAIAQARESAEASASREAASISGCESSINSVLDGFRGVTEALAESADVLKRESLGIQADVCEALVQLQFQDRVSQVMTHVRQNIDMLPEHLAQGSETYEREGRLVPLDVPGLLAELEKTYAMAEERSTHGGGGSAGAPKNEEITFF